MRKIVFKKSYWQSFLSFIVLAVFAYIAMATFGGISQQKYQLPDGRWEISKHYSDGNTETTTGNVDKEGRWDGPVKVEYENDNYILTHTEEVNMKEGKRHGVSKVIYPSGYVAYYCYQHGERVDDENCEKSAIISSEDVSAYSIFSYEVPWFAFKLDACGFDSVYVKAYLDAIETILYSKDFNEEDFDDYYDDAIEDLEVTAYDSIIGLNAEFSIYNGLDLILNNEFRLATLQSYGESDSNTYNVVKTIYPNYLLRLNEGEVTDADFEGFCNEYDNIMSGYDPIALDDPFWVDSLDERMYRAIDSIYSSDEKSAIAVQLLKSAVLLDGFNNIRILQREYISQIKNQVLDYTPKDVAGVVLVSFLEKFIFGDLIKSAVKEAYSIKKGIVRLPTVTTNFSGNNSSTSVTLNGNLIEDGGGEIILIGIAWGTVYNPTVDNQILTVTTGTRDFETNLTGLIEGETYYARTFATNIAGTAYGNCISFVATRTTGINDDYFDRLVFDIYPNPVTKDATIRFKTKESESLMFVLYDLNGKVVLQKELTNMVLGENRLNLNLSEIKNGVYTCRLTGDKNEYKTLKFLINR